MIFRQKNSDERAKLISLLKQEGHWGDVEDLDVFVLKKIIHNREWSEEILNKLKHYQEGKTTATVRLANLEEGGIKKTSLRKIFR